MGSQALIPKIHMSVEEYLRTSFDGADREYLDGEVVERNMGNKSHGRIQGTFVLLFRLQEKRTGLYVVPEVRHRITATRYRIPDVAVFEGEPSEEVPSVPPLIAIEILSPDDRIGHIISKLKEYRAWGVRHIWLADPETRKLFVYTDSSLDETSVFALPEHGITISAAELFD